MSVPIERLREFGRRVYVCAGMAEDDAETVVEVQLTSDLRGVDTHGFQRLPWYFDRLVSGENNPRPEPFVVKETAVTLALDADNGLGQLVCTRLLERLIPKARQSGVAIGTLRNSNDWGCGAYYPMLAAAAGLVCFGTTTSVPTLAPFGSRTRMVGNNPMVFALPRGEGPPIVLDMALTPVALGKVLRAISERTEIPESWGFLDSDGKPTTDPRAAINGVIPAIGGYKGTGLALVMNALAGIFSGSAHSAEVNVGRRGQFFLVFEPLVFGADGWAEAVEDMATQVKSAEPLPDVAEAYLPGEIEERSFAERSARGAIPYPQSVIAALVALGEKTGIEFSPEGV